MARVTLNGRNIDIPSTATDLDVKQAGGIHSGRTLIRRERTGNYVIPRGSRVNAKDGDVFVDSPNRIKG